VIKVVAKQLTSDKESSQGSLEGKMSEFELPNFNATTKTHMV
jgi:hypothetical protein